MTSGPPERVTRPLGAIVVNGVLGTPPVLCVKLFQCVKIVFHINMHLFDYLP